MIEKIKLWQRAIPKHIVSLSHVLKIYDLTNDILWHWKEHAHSTLFQWRQLELEYSDQ